MKVGTKRKVYYSADVVNSISPTSFIAQHTKWSAWKTLLSHSHLIGYLGEEDNLEDTEYKNIE